MRLELTGAVVVFICAVAVGVLAPRNAGLAGLALTSALNLTGTLAWMVRQTTELEVNMNSGGLGRHLVERAHAERGRRRGQGQGMGTDEHAGQPMRCRQHLLALFLVSELPCKLCSAARLAQHTAPCWITTWSMRASL